MINSAHRNSWFVALAAICVFVSMAGCGSEEPAPDTAFTSQGTGAAAPGAAPAAAGGGSGGDAPSVGGTVQPMKPPTGPDGGPP